MALPAATKGTLRTESSQPPWPPVSMVPWSAVTMRVVRDRSSRGDQLGDALVDALDHLRVDRRRPAVAVPRFVGAGECKQEQ